MKFFSIEIKKKKARICQHDILLIISRKIPIYLDHFGVSKSGLKNNFGQSQMCSLISGTVGEENRGKLAHKPFGRVNLF